MKCRVCGQELPEGARFCFACGNPMEDVPAPKKLEEPLDPSLAGGAVPMVPVAPPPRATRVEPRAVRVRAARAVHPGSAQGSLERRFRETMVDTGVFPQQDLAGSRRAWEDPDEKNEDAEKDGGASAADVAEVEEAPSTAAETVTDGAPADAPLPEGDADAATATAEADAVPVDASASEADGLLTDNVPEADAAPTADATAAADAAAENDADGDAPAEKTSSLPIAAWAGEAADRLGEARDGLAGTMRSAFGESPVEKGGPRWALAGALVAAVAVTVALIAFVSTSWLGPLAAPSEPAPEVHPPSDGSIAPLDEREPEEEEPEEGDALPEGAPEARAAMADYSWDELSQIAALIADADTDEAAIELAATYNLCAADGSLDGSQSKDLVLADGTTVPMRVAGFRQDERADGEGAAGITLIAGAPVAEMAMCPNGDKGVGWRDTTLRAWMNGELAEQLPEDLAGLVVSVNKTTNPVLGSGSEQVVTEDALWVPSYTEVTGNASDGDAQAEGTQYRLFADLGVERGENSSLAMGGVYWWERSPSQRDESWFLCVTPEGMAGMGHRPATPNGVVMGFCL